MNSLLSFLSVKDGKENSQLVLANYPPIYNIFITTYNVDESLYNFLVTYINYDGNFDSFGSFYYNLNDNYNALEWNTFFNLKELQDVVGVIDHIVDHSKVKLAYIGLLSGYPICLGLNGENSDKIFFPGDNIYENGLIKLADNIFEFCKKFTFTIDPEYINPSNLYKNWNEDIWRIKPPDFRDSRRYELLDKDSLDKRYNELKKSKADLSEIESEYRIRGFDLPKKFLFW